MVTSIATILVVYDETRTLRMIQHIFELERYRVITAISEEAAIGVFEQEIPDLIILDIIMREFMPT